MSGPSDKECGFFLERKKRYCRFQPRPGEKYCPDHACALGFETTRKRIPCPLNPKHNIYEDSLEKHIKKCNVTKQNSHNKKLGYYVKSLNHGLPASHIANKEKKVKDLSSDELNCILVKVNHLYAEHVPKIDVLQLEHEVIKKETLGSAPMELSQAFSDQVMVRKEMLQQASLVGQLDNLGLLSDGHCFVELGAGRGKLSHWVYTVNKSNKNNAYFLVDRSSFRHKMEGQIRKKEGELQNFDRIRQDIEDLCLGLIPGVQNHESVVVIGKHLCGGATDIGLRCAVETLGLNTEEKLSTFLSLSQGLGSSKLFEESKECNPKSHNKAEPDVQTIVAEQGGEGEDTKELQVGDLLDEGTKVCQEDQRAKNEITITSAAQDSNNACLEDKKADCSPPPNKKTKREPLSGLSGLPYGIMIALCCHHQCTWDTYVGRDFMEKIGVTESEFDLLARLSSWATCARVRPRSGQQSSGCKQSAGAQGKKDSTQSEQTAEKSIEKQDEMDSTLSSHHAEDLAKFKDNSSSLRDQLSVPEREDIGRKCKRIIDMGRIMYLKEKGMPCFLREYVSDDVTPENVVLLGKRKDI